MHQNIDVATIGKVNLASDFVNDALAALESLTIYEGMAVYAEIGSRVATFQIVQSLDFDSEYDELPPQQFDRLDQSVVAADALVYMDDYTKNAAAFQTTLTGLLQRVERAAANRGEVLVRAKS